MHHHRVPGQRACCSFLVEAIRGKELFWSVKQLWALLKVHLQHPRALVLDHKNLAELPQSISWIQRHVFGPHVCPASGGVP